MECSWGLFHVQSEYGEFLLLFSPPEGDVRASLVLAKYKFCGHKFNNKTYKMKKFLLFLSCFLITWCSVQAANPTGKITSATYNASSSTFSVSCTASNPNNVYMDAVCMATGIEVSKVKLSTYSSNTINLPITSRAGEYDLVLFVDGTPCYDKKVSVTQYGHINNVTNISTNSVTVNYSMFHAETDKYPNNSYLKIGNYKHNITNVKNGSYTWKNLKLTEGQTYTCEIYVDGNRKHTYQFTVPKKYGHINNVYNISTSSVTVNYTMRYAETSNCYLKIGNYKHNITNVENGSYTWSGLNLTEGQTYTCEIYVDGVRKDTYSFTVPGQIWSTAIRSITPMGNNKIKIDFTLSNTGVNVGFRVHTVSLSGNKGETTPYDYGRCDQHEGTYEAYVPYYSGQVAYTVEILVNGSSVNGKTIVVNNR